MNIDIRRIVEITDNAIVYKDDRGDTAMIELSPCANNWEKQHQKTAEKGVSRCVGDRCFGEYAYYELYDIGHTRFYLDLRTSKIKKWIGRLIEWNFHQREFELFHSVQKQLNAHGWTTADLT